MMETEEEQIQKIKDFFKQYGKSILIGFVVVIAGLWSWNAWQTRNNQLRETASIAYSQTLLHLNSSEANRYAHYLIKQYPKTTYASLSALLLAQQAVEKKGAFKEAKRHLQWVIKQNVDPFLHDLASLRLARILVSQKDYQPAQQLLKTMTVGSLVAIQHEVQGDLFYAQGNLKKAHAAYKEAMKEASEDNSLLKMKYDDTTV